MSNSYLSDPVRRRGGSEKLRFALENDPTTEDAWQRASGCFRLMALALQTKAPSSGEAGLVEVMEQVRRMLQSNSEPQELGPGEFTFGQQLQKQLDEDYNQLLKAMGLDGAVTELEAEGVMPPQGRLEKWEFLARVIGEDPGPLTMGDIYERAVAWVFRQRVNGTGRVASASKNDALPSGSGSGVKFEQMLKLYLENLDKTYQKLVDDTMAGLSGSIERFEVVFGPTAIARHWYKQAGVDSPSRPQLSRVKKAISDLTLYRENIRPVLHGQRPKGWKSPKGEFSEDIALVRLQRRRRGHDENN